MSRVVISLSTIPSRFAEIGPTLHSLLQQKRRADEVLLFIPCSYRRFPGWDGTLPDVPDGVKILRTDNDLGPATKVLSAARRFRGQDVEIVFCDDDRLYRPTLVSDFLRTRRIRTGCAIANLGLRAEEITVSTGRNRTQPRVHRTWRITDIEFQLRYLAAQIKAGRRWREAREPWRRVY